MRRTSAAVAWVLAIGLGACAGESASASASAVVGWPDFAPAREMPPADGPLDSLGSGPNGGVILAPGSAAIASGTAYRFSLGHCGLLSPVDVDGGFWDAIDGVTAGGDPLDLSRG